MPSPIKSTVAKADTVMTAVKKLSHQLLKGFRNHLRICGKHFVLKAVLLQVAIKACYPLFRLVTIIHVKKQAGGAVSIAGIGRGDFLSLGKFSRIVGIRIGIQPDIRIYVIVVNIAICFTKIIKITAIV